MRFTFFNTKIYVSFLFMALICIFLLIDKTGLFLPMMFASVIHETGHLFLMWIFGCQPKEINLILGSVQIISNASSKNFKNILISFSGPLFNIIVFTVLFINYAFYRNEEYITFAFTNLLLGIFNLFPLKGLDGGNILFHILEDRYNTNVAFKTLNITSMIFGVITVILAVTLTINGNFNIGMYVLALYLILSVLLKF